MKDLPGSVAPRTRHRLRHVVPAIIVVLVASFAVPPALAADAPADRELQVVGGAAVPDGKYPFMVSLQHPNIGSLRGHFCGGTLIDADSVLTAAHCAEIIGRETVPGSVVSYRDVRLVVGATVLNSSQGRTRRIARLSHVSIHPLYNGNRDSAYDAAVIRLNRPVGSIPPVMLDAAGSDRFERPGRRLTVAGWGVTRFGASRIPNRMREASPPVVSDSRCRLAYAGIGDPAQRVYPRLMVCAGKARLDTCQGDSGGPLFAAVRGGFRQVGITSFGYECGTPGFPGVYTEISAPSIRGFIRKAAG